MAILSSIVIISAEHLLKKVKNINTHFLLNLDAYGAN